MFKMCLFIVILFIGVEFSYSAPSQNLDTYPGSPTVYAYVASHPRFPTIGDLISSSSWFPIEINVPEVFGNIVSGIQAIPATISNGVSGIMALVQRIPFINRFNSPEKPRPYLIFIPDKPINVENGINYLEEVDLIPNYP
ncbi:hypothetical protein RI129_005451 [Pyrocoelia pectoralis]|uniref:Uncharacterized protein n=1 Tax=Pyrocoelia pectoralis TaxID=417401 RepID=A0AAN7ZLJ8_9COLE